MQKTIYFRADGNNDIGMGHVIRCLALSNILKEQFNCIFVTRFTNEFIIKEIKKSCSHYIKLKEDSDEHFEEFLLHLKKHDVVVLDNYFFNTCFQKKIKNIGCKLVCIDDLHDKHYVADAVINHIPGISKDQFSVETYTKLCLGLNYALLRPPFFNIIPRKRIKLNRCLICMGGADKYNITNNLVLLLHDIEIIDVIDVIIGPTFLHTKELEKAKLKSMKTVNIFSNLTSKDMVERMQIADFGILPASSISIEALAVGMPFMVGHTVYNQEELYYNLTNKYSIYGLGNLLNLDKVFINNFNINNDFNFNFTTLNLKRLFDNL